MLSLLITNRKRELFLPYFLRSDEQSLKLEPWNSLDLQQERYCPSLVPNECSIWRCTDNGVHWTRHVSPTHSVIVSTGLYCHFLHWTPYLAMLDPTNILFVPDSVVFQYLYNFLLLYSMHLFIGLITLTGHLSYTSPIIRTWPPQWSISYTFALFGKKLPLGGDIRGLIR